MTRRHRSSSRDNELEDGEEQSRRSRRHRSSSRDDELLESGRSSRRRHRSSSRDDELEDGEDPPQRRGRHRSSSRDDELEDRRSSRRNRHRSSSRDDQMEVSVHASVVDDAPQAVRRNEEAKVAPVFASMEEGRQDEDDDSRVEELDGKHRRTSYYCIIFNVLLVIAGATVALHFRRRQVTS